MRRVYIIRARLDGGIRNQAARGELRQGPAGGLASQGEQDGEVLFHPDAAVLGAIRTVFERFAEFGSARRVWLWFRSEGLSFPLQTTSGGLPSPIRWVVPTYTTTFITSSTIRCMLALTYGKTKYERATWMNTAPSENVVGICPWISGLFSFRTIIPDSSVGNLSGQSGAARFQHPTPAALRRRCRERRISTVAGPSYHMRSLRPSSACSLSRPKLGSRLHHCAGGDLVAGRGTYTVSTPAEQ